MLQIPKRGHVSLVARNQKASIRREMEVDRITEMKQRGASLAKLQKVR